VTTADSPDPVALLRRFETRFGRQRDDPSTAATLFFAPGRVNLIGDHTDVTGGLVFPCGIDRGSHLVIRRNGERRYRFASTDFDLFGDLGAHEIGQRWGDTWINYPLGVIDQFKRRGIDIDGVDCLFSGNIPNGAGLSSSASIEVVTAHALNRLFDAGLSPLEQVKLARAAENDFVGMHCGIMDQFAVAMAEDGHAMLLDCTSLEHRQVPLRLGDNALLVTNTNQRRELNESAYNARVAECDRALALLAPVLGVTQLADVGVADLQSQAHRFDADPDALARARHVTSENARVRLAVPALESGDVARFGELMNASHDSLRDDYQVSSEPLDALVRLSREQPGVLGSRLTGAGFGGCTVTLLPRDSIDDFIATVGKAYREATGLTADFYRIHPGPGVMAVPLPGRARAPGTSPGQDSDTRQGQASDTGRGQAPDTGRGQA